jgi:hypothetical protein
MAVLSPTFWGASLFVYGDEAESKKLAKEDVGYTFYGAKTHKAIKVKKGGVTRVGITPGYQDKMVGGNSTKKGGKKAS